MAGGVHVTALPPTGLDADVRMLASYHWCGVRRVLLQDNRGATVETGGPGRSIDLGSAPTRHRGAGHRFEIAALRVKEHWPVSGDPTEHTRRGLYVLVLRNFRFPMFDVFDAPVSSVSCPQRDVTTVAPQALFSLNSPTVYRQAKQLAGRVVKETEGGSAQWVETLWKIALARPIEDGEKVEALQLFENLSNAQTDEQIRATLGEAPESFASLPPQQAAALVKLCLAVYNLNEFAFVH